MPRRYQLLDLLGHLVSKLVRKAEAVDDEGIKGVGSGSGHYAALCLALDPSLELALPESEEESLEDSFLEVPFESELSPELLSDPELDPESELSPASVLFPPLLP